MKPIIDGALAGVAGNIASRYVGAWGAPIATLGIGYFRKNNTLKTIGGIEAGAMLGSMVGGVFGGGNGNGGGFFHS